MKKLVSVLLCVILALSLCCGAVSAAGIDYLEAALAPAAADSDAELVLTAKQTLTNATIRISFDPELLRCTGISHDLEVMTGQMNEGEAVVRLATSTADAIQSGETVVSFDLEYIGYWSGTDVTVTVENWNAQTGVNAEQVVTVPGPGSRFVDVPADAWYFDEVEEMAEAGLIKGISATHFGPELPMNRSSFVTLLGRADGKADTKAETVFVDVPFDSYYSGHVAWAVENGITNGVDAAHFNPDDGVTRAQMVTFLYRYARYLGQDVTVEDPEQVLSAFSDCAEVLDNQWAAEPFAWAVEQGIVNGMDGMLNPEGIANRAQAAAVLYRFLFGA